MIIMEFKEMQKIWDTQNNQPLYAINETALHDRIIRKRNRASHMANWSEILLIVVNLLLGGVLLAMDIFDSKGAGIYAYLLTAFMLLTAGYVFVRRMRRKKNENNFEQSMLGDLEHAIANAQYQAYLSQTMLRWYVLPVAVLSVLNMLDREISDKMILLVGLVFILAFFGGRWEYNSIHLARKRELEGMRDKLIQLNERE